MLPNFFHELKFGISRKSNLESNLQQLKKILTELFQFFSQGIGYAYTNNRETLFPFPLVTTLFSASNYCGTYTNKGAILIIYNDDLKVREKKNL